MSKEHPQGSASLPPLGAVGAGTGRRSLRWLDGAGLVACALAGAAWYMVSVAPLQEARAARQQLWEKLQPRLEIVAALQHQTSLQQQTLASVGEQIASGELQLRSIDQINQRIADLTAAAGGESLRLDEVKPGEPAAMQWFMTVPIKLSGAGEYPDIGAFLHMLPRTFPDVAVVGFSVNGEPEAIDKTPRFELNLVWYAAPRITK